MRKLPDIVRNINLDSIGEITNEPWRGMFSIKVVLTHSERFAVERAYKAMLPDDKGVDNSITMRCAAIAELEQRLIAAPEWFKNSRNGRDLIDSQPLYDLLSATYEKLAEWKAELAQSANPETKSPEQ